MKELAEIDVEQQALNNSAILQQALNVFGNQDIYKKPVEEITLRELEICRNKAVNFLSTLSGIQEVNHHIEIISADKYKFKRKDELKTLNSLLRCNEKLTSTLEKTITLITQKLDRCLESEDIDIEEIIALQNMLNQTIDSSQKITSSFGRLINIERLSGGRLWGQQKQLASNINIIEKLENTQTQNFNKETVRELSEEEILKLDV